MADYDISEKYQIEIINGRNRRFAREDHEFTGDLHVNMERGGNSFSSVRQRRQNEWLVANFARIVPQMIRPIGL
jgi:hypothetical protein